MSFCFIPSKENTVGYISSLKFKKDVSPIFLQVSNFWQDFLSICFSLQNYIVDPNIVLVLLSRYDTQYVIFFCINFYRVDLNCNFKICVAAKFLFIYFI